MTKMILVALALASGVASAAQLDAADFSCYGLRKEIARNGFQYVNGTLVRASADDCSDYAQEFWTTTGDGWTCPTGGYVCLSSNPNASLTSN